MFQDAKNNVVALTEAVFDRAELLLEQEQAKCADQTAQAAARQLAIDKRGQDLDERERLLAAREQGVKSVQDLAAVRHAANQKLREQLQDTEDRLKAVKKELSDLKSKINNPSFQKPLAVDAVAP